jgi:hypothetical protein
MCQEFLAIIQIYGVEVCIYDVNCENQHKNVEVFFLYKKFISFFILNMRVWVSVCLAALE